MNKRILELAEQAGWMMGDEVEGFNIRLEKFSLLIVQEILSYTKDGDLDFMKFMIKKHFGVEE